MCNIYFTFINSGNLQIKYTLLNLNDQLPQCPYAFGKKKISYNLLNLCYGEKYVTQFLKRN